ncbi:MAG: pilus assembly protein [Sphingomonas bacterium]
MTDLSPSLGDRGPSGGRWSHLLGRFRRSEDGATAIEFGFVAVPFFMLICAILETALMFFANEALEEALSQASRNLLTGQALSRYTSSNPAVNAAAFRDDICALAPTGLIDCSKLYVDVKTYTSFGNAGTGTTNPIAGGVLNVSGFTYTQPQPKQIIVARAVLDYRLFLTSWASAYLANIGSGHRALIATTTFRTEPFCINC